MLESMLAALRPLPARTRWDTECYVNDMAASSAVITITLFQSADVNVIVVPSSLHVGVFSAPAIL